MQTRPRTDEERQFCIAQIVGRDQCGCAYCESDIATRRARVWIYVTAAFIAIFLLFAIFAAPEAQCQRPGNCYGGCVLGTGCGTGPGCACVPSLPGSPLGTCVGG